jgi:hypothetical protein
MGLPMYQFGLPLLHGLFALLSRGFSRGHFRWFKHFLLFGRSAFNPMVWCTCTKICIHISTQIWHFLLLPFAVTTVGTLSLSLPTGSFSWTKTSTFIIPGSCTRCTWEEVCPPRDWLKVFERLGHICSSRYKVLKEIDVESESVQ